MKLCPTGSYPKLCAKIITAYGRPSPLAQKDSDFFADRSTGSILAFPGTNIAPAQRVGKPLATTSPAISRHPLLPCAPPGAIFRMTVDFPPIERSVQAIQPAPNRLSGFSCSKSLTSPSSEAAARKVVRSAGTPSFHTPAMSRVALISVIGSPFTKSRSARLPGAIVPRSSKRNTRAAAEVAPTSASVGVSPASTSSSSSRCSVAPGVVPGFGTSSPTRIGTPAASNCFAASTEPAQLSLLGNVKAFFKLAS